MLWMTDIVSQIAKHILIDLTYSESESLLPQEYVICHSKLLRCDTILVTQF